MRLGNMVPHHLFSFTSKTPVITTAIYITFIAVIIDTSLNQTYYLNVNQSVPPHIKVIIFVAISGICLIGQYWFLQFVKAKSTDITKANILHIRTFIKEDNLVQFVLASFFMSLLFQIL